MVMSDGRYANSGSNQRLAGDPRAAEFVKAYAEMKQKQQTITVSKLFVASSLLADNEGLVGQYNDSMDREVFRVLGGADVG